MSEDKSSNNVTDLFLAELIARYDAAPGAHWCGRAVVDCLRELQKRRADETSEKPINPRGRCGPAEPDNDLVICPTCTSQFRAVPVNVQQQLAAYEELLGERATALKTRLDKRFPEEPVRTTIT